MTTISVRIDDHELKALVKEMPGQVAFAASRTVNELAKQSQIAIQHSIHEHFIVRRASFIDRSIKIKPFATKQTLTATIQVSPPGGGTDVLSRFEEGGPRPHKSMIAIPQQDVRKDVHKVIPKAKRPRNLKNTFTVQKGNDVLLFVRKGKGKRRTVQLFYRLVPRATLPPLLHFEDTITHIVNANYARIFEQEFAFAVKTAR